MAARTRRTSLANGCRIILTLLLVEAAGFALTACNADAVAGPSKISEPIGEVGGGGDNDGGDIGGIGGPGRPCLLFKASPCR